MQITMIGHSTVTIEIGGKRIITDPYFGMWGHVAYARTAPPARTREALQDADLVLVSHNHWDHIDRRYLRLLAEDRLVLAPRWTAWMTRLHGAKNVVGVQNWASHRFDEIIVTAVPAVHLTVSAGFVVHGEGKQIYFAGDTFYHPFMERLGRAYQIDVALMPVTTFAIPMTMGENGAVRAVRAIGPSTVIPIHLGVQPRSPLLRTRHTPQGFAEKVRRAGLETRVVSLSEGQSWAL